MTVASDISDITYVRNGVTQIFSVPFYFLDDTDLVVQNVSGDTTTTLVLNTDYTVSGAGDESGGEITCLSAGTSGDTLYIERVVALTQETALPANTPMPSDSLEQALDRAMMACQQLQRAIDAGVQLSTAAKVNNVSALFPDPLANAAIGWNDSATAFANISLPDTGTGTYAPGFTGAVASRLVADKLRESVSVEDFGAAGDGVTDDSAHIQAAINYLASVHGGVLNFAAKTYAITQTLAITTGNITLAGRGGDMPHDGGANQAPATTLKWTNASGAVMVKFESPTGAANAKQYRGGMQGFLLDGSSIATVGLFLHSWYGGQFSEIYVGNVTSSAYKLSCYVAGSLAEACDTQYNIFQRCQWRMITSAAVQSADGFLITADTPGGGANSSFNTFINCAGETYNGSGWHMGDADNNAFIACRNYVTGGGYGALLEGAYSNTWFNWGGSVRAKGTASSAFQNSTMNCFYGVDDANGTSYPTLDAGCDAQWHSTKHGWVMLRSAKAVFATTQSGVDTELANMNTETIRIRSTTQDHVRLTDGTNEWSVRIDSSGNLDFLRVSGTGIAKFDQGIAVGTFNTHADAAVVGYITINDVTGTARKLAIIA